MGGITVSFTGPAAGSTIYIGIADTNHLSGTVNDTVKIDRIAILPR